MLPYVAHDPRFVGLVIRPCQSRKAHQRLPLGRRARLFRRPGVTLSGLIFPNNRMMRFDETDSSVSVFRAPSSNSNGNTTDRQGRLVSCEHFMRRVTRTEHDGSITVLADAFEGHRLNSPNDVVVKSDNSIWFSDPTYGIDSDYEGQQSPSEIGASNVYRIDGSSGAITRVVSDRVQPNGLAFSPDETPALCRRHRRDPCPRASADDLVLSGQGTNSRGSLTVRHLPGRALSTASAATSMAISGPRQAAACSATQPDGTHLGTIAIGEIVANVCFGGPRRNRLYICGQTSLYSIYLNTRAAV